MLLAIDTSTGTSVAIVHHGSVLAEAHHAGTRGHAEAVGDLISRALAEAGTTPRDLDGVVAGMGPGPFTGLRVGIAAARALAFGAGVPLHPVVSHDGAALVAGRACLVVTDARRRELAWSAYAEPDDGLPVRLAGPSLAAAAELDGVAGAVEALGAHADLERIRTELIPAAGLALLAERLLAAGRPTGPAEPLYLRAPDAAIPGGPKRVTA